MALMIAWARESEHFCGMSPTRRRMRKMCVSSGKTSLRQAKSSVQATVFGPMPRNFERYATASSAGSVVQEREVEQATLFFDLPEHGADDRRLLVGESARANRVGERGFACAQDGFPRGEAFFQSGKGAVAVRVARRLREDRGDEFVERVGARRAFVYGHAVGAFEVLDDVADRLFVERVCPVLARFVCQRRELIGLSRFSQPLPRFSTRR